jgi:serine/threonine protein kinase
VLVQVVEKCHELGILHGDLKPANFVLADRTRNPLFSNDINLLFGEPWLLAIDFGCSQYLGSQRFTKRTGTPGKQERACVLTSSSSSSSASSSASLQRTYLHMPSASCDVRLHV